MEIETCLAVETEDKERRALSIRLLCSIFLRNSKMQLRKSL